jgi:hypothetical protein
MRSPHQLPELGEKDQARFWAKVALPNEQGCMLWLRSTTTGGYGQFKINGRMRLAHRVSYTLTYGPIPSGLTIDHVKTRGCTNKHCVAPLHLEAVPNAVNVLRANPGAWQKQKTRCANGHAFDEVNTYQRPRGGRDCQICKRLRNRRSRQKRAA